LLVRAEPAVVKLPEAAARRMIQVIDLFHSDDVTADCFAELKTLAGDALQHAGETTLALERYREAFAHAQAPELKCSALLKRGGLLEAQDVDEAIAHYKRCIDLLTHALPHSRLLVRAQIDIAWLAMQARTDLAQAEVLLSQASALLASMHMHDLALTADVHNAWARYYFLTKQPALGIDHRMRAYLAALESNDPTRTMKLAHNLGQDYRDAGDSVRALKYLEHSLALATRQGNRLLEGINHKTIGGLHFLKRDYSAAIASYTQACDVFIAFGNKDAHGWTLYDLCEAYIEIGQSDAAQRAHQAGLHLAAELGLTRLRDELNTLTPGGQPSSEPERKRAMRRALAINHAATHGAITNRAYREQSGVSQKQAVRDLSAWVSEGTFVSSGAGRSRNYRLTDVVRS
jgi:tetratricopeptide (TPR) repeat protein